MPPLHGSGFTDMMADAARGLGWHAFPGPAAINSPSYQNRTGCVYHGFCSRAAVGLDPTVTDPLGHPVCRITADFKDNERAVAAYIQDKMVEWYRAAGAIATEKGPVGTMGPRHAYGGTRMGDNAATSVVNRWGFSHELPNLDIF